MIVPEGYEKLAVIGIAYKGQYAPNATYKLLNAVYYEGSTFVALKDNPVNPPVADGVNWQYLAKGFLDGMLSAIDAKDTSGLIGTAGETVDAQALLDDIADRVATKLLLKNQIVNNLLATIPGNALDAMQGKALSDRLDQVNSDIRYNPDTDYIQCQVNGIWVNWEFAALQFDGVLISQNFLDTKTSGGWNASANFALQSNGYYRIQRASGGANVSTINTLNLLPYSQLVLKYTGKSPASCEAQIGVNGNYQRSTSTNGTLVLDISGESQGIIEVSVYSTAGYFDIVSLILK